MRSFLHAIAVLLISLIGHGFAWAADAWKPAPFVLMTRWAKDVDPDHVLPDYPRPQMVRKEWMNLNGLWDYAMVKNDDRGTAAPRDFQGKILVPFPIESALSGVLKRLDGRLWYHRTVELPASFHGNHVLLHFGAVDWETAVFVNGIAVGSHRGGYDPFSFDITAALHERGTQQLDVAVVDPTGGPLGAPKGKQNAGEDLTAPAGGLSYMSVSGIWQTVWLEPVPEISIADVRMVPDIDAKTLTLTIAVAGDSKNAEVEVVASDSGVVVATAKGHPDMPLTLAIPHPKLWTPSQPFLYDLQVSLTIGGKTVDMVGSYAGMRKIGMAKDAKGDVRIQLNHADIFQVGPLDQGYWPDGIYTAPTDAALRFDIEAIKTLGGNVSRKHMKVEPARWYYWCDKLGLLVWQDMVGGNAGKDGKRISDAAATQFEAELKAMIDNLFDHPCIIMWTLFNEDWGMYDLERLSAWMKEYDPTRLVNANSGGNSRGSGDILDAHAYGMPEGPHADGKRAIVIGEFGGRARKIDGHVTCPNSRPWGHPGGTCLADAWELTAHYGQLMRAVYAHRDDRGVCAAIYTQLTDVEDEMNGMLTYDRAVFKVESERMAEAFMGRFPPTVTFSCLSPLGVGRRFPSFMLMGPGGAGAQGTSLWRYTVDRPADTWYKPDFDVSGWQEGPAPFGSKHRGKTQWATHDIWLSRDFTIAGDAVLNRPELIGTHAEACEVYINGLLANQISGYTSESQYMEFGISEPARATLKPGINRVSIHCHHHADEQSVDFGIVDPVSKPVP